MGWKVDCWHFYYILFAIMMMVVVVWWKKRRRWRRTQRHDDGIFRQFLNILHFCVAGFVRRDGCLFVFVQSFFLNPLFNFFFTDRPGVLYYSLLLLFSLFRLRGLRSHGRVSTYINDLHFHWHCAVDFITFFFLIIFFSPSNFFFFYFLSWCKTFY